MKIITKKQQKEIEQIKRENEFLSIGRRAMEICLDYQRAIVSILKTLNIKEIQIDKSLLYTNQDEIEVSEDIMTHSFKIKLVEKV